MNALALVKAPDGRRVHDALYSRAGLQAFGVVMLALLAGIGWLGVAIFHQDFTTVAPVSVQLRTAGTQLEQGADVKLRGLIVGEVRKVATNGRYVTLHLAIQPDDLRLIPADVEAHVVPKTLFGEKYVDLVIPPHHSGRHLLAGAVIGEDRSQTSIETSKVLNDLGPLLRTVQPAKLNAALTALGQTLAGRGDEIGRTMQVMDAYLRELNPQLPTFLHDVGAGATVADEYAAVTDRLAAAGVDASTTSQLVAAEAGPLAQALARTTAMANTTTRVLQANGERIIAMNEAYRPLLTLLAKFAPELPCSFHGAVASVGRLDDPWHEGKLHARLFLVPSRGAYKHGQDDPKPIPMDDQGPYCPVLPKNGKGGVPNAPIPPEAQFLLGKPQPLSVVGPGLVGIPQPSAPIPLGDAVLGGGAVTAQVPPLVDLLVGPMLPGAAS